MTAIPLALLVGLAGAPLDSRAADRAIALAFETELAGDASGAREALEALIAGARSPREAVGRGRLQRWLSALPARAPAWRPEASRAEVLQAWRAMGSTDPRLRDRAWSHWEQRVPALKAALPPVAVVVDRAVGLPEPVVSSRLSRALSDGGLRLDPEGLELAVDLDAASAERDGRWWRVRAELSFVLTSTGSEATRSLALFAKTRAERRTTEAAARRQVTRRLLQDAAAAVSHAARRRALAAAWPVEPR